MGGTDAQYLNFSVTVRRMIGAAAMLHCFIPVRTSQPQEMSLGALNGAKNTRITTLQEHRPTMQLESRVDGNMRAPHLNIGATD
jgi:hypothetical protein